MMDPPVTSSPPNFFTPRRWALESRPFFELPNPFLCAMVQSFCSIFRATIRPVLVRTDFGRLLRGAVAVAVHFDGVDADLGVILTVTLHLLVLLLALVVEDQNLLAASFAHHGGENLRGRGVGDAVVAGEGQDFAELDGAILAGCCLFNLDHIAR